MQFDGIENAAKVILKFLFSNYKTKLSMNRLEVFIFLELKPFNDVFVSFSTELEVSKNISDIMREQ